MTTHATALDLTLIIDQPPGIDSAPTWGTPYQFVTTADGAADCSTVVSSQLGSYTDTDDDFAGWLLECVSGSAYQNVGVRRQIVAHSEAAGVVTLVTERWPMRVMTGDVFRMIDTTRCTPYIADDTGGSAVQMRDATRNLEVDDHWLGSAAVGGPYLEIIKADNISTTTLRTITDWTQVGGIAQATLGANSAIGDLAEILCCPEWEKQGFMTCTVEPLPRENTMGTYDTPLQARGRRTATGPGILHFRGPGTASSTGRTEAHRILTCAMDDVETSDLTVNDPGAAGTTVSTPYDAGSAVKGQLYCTQEGSVSMCTDGDPTPATWAPPLRVRAADNSTVTCLTNYSVPRASQLNHECYLKQFRGDAVVERIWAAVPRLSFTGELNSYLRINCDFEGLDWERNYQSDAGIRTRAWRAVRPTVPPFKIAGGRVVLYSGLTGNGYQDLALRSFTVALNERYDIATEAHAPQGVLGHRFLGCSPTGSFVGDLATTTTQYSSNLVETYAPGTELGPLLIQVGSRVRYPGVWAFWAYSVQVVNCQIQDDNGKLSLAVDWKINDIDTDTLALPSWEMGIG